MSMYTLTELTGRRRNQDRTIVIATVEASKRTWVAGILGAIGGGIVAMPLVLLTAGGPILGAAAGAAAAIFLFTKRSSTGLKQEYYKQFRDRAKAKKRLGVLTMCNEPVRLDVGVSRIVPSSRRLVDEPFIGGEAPDVKRFHASDTSNRPRLHDRRPRMDVTHTDGV
ncbi:hypothetical protein F8O07_06925 [Pseudoclavibacter sp. CFCC 13796]|uniref:hypothetical protein n=1 Tax=Pseudoclavibacter sp. CFCC 13796 TaxID=2615179 RepID=UPI001301669E|nr:hypothetical protein [Pseudoclavibacter sp. CFCC 13796]KAB1661632.1 hypothetical protein F8O07_06925 [Pseudoclavibacter sp. CFCC 13796]